MNKITVVVPNDAEVVTVPDRWMPPNMIVVATDGYWYILHKGRSLPMGGDEVNKMYHNVLRNLGFEDMDR